MGGGDGVWSPSSGNSLGHADAKGGGVWPQYITIVGGTTGLCGHVAPYGLSPASEGGTAKEGGGADHVNGTREVRCEVPEMVTWDGPCNR